MADTYAADVTWSLMPGEDFRRGRYSRGHVLQFDGGVTMLGSASPHVVGQWADPSAVDPEEMLVAALASCHMLSFLHVARVSGLCVASYRDHAEGVLEAIEAGRQAVTKVVLHPRIEWDGEEPDAARLARLHHEAHETCFIANSLKTEVSVA